MKKKSPATEVSQAVDRSEAIALLAGQGLGIVAPLKKVRTIIPTGISNFDNDILGIGGIPCGCAVQCWGPKNAGKTTLMYRTIAKSQRQRPERLAVLLDTEYAYSEERARDAGVDVDSLQVTQGNITEYVYDKLLRYTASGACSIICMDSLANSIPRAESTNYDRKKSKDDKDPSNQPGQFSKITKRFMRDLCRYADETDTGLWFSNQQTQKIGVMYGSNLDYPGGESFKHNLQLSLCVRNAGYIDEGKGNHVGVIVAVTVDKNKFAPERKTDDSTHLRLYYKNGIEISRKFSLVDDAVRAGLITGKGWYVLTDSKGEQVGKWNGIDTVREALAADDELSNNIGKWIRELDGNLPPALAA